jgi:hypothetical protein
MKFIAKLLVWVSRGTVKTPQVFPKLRGSAKTLASIFTSLS